MRLHKDIVELQLKAKEDFPNPDKWSCIRKAQNSFNRSLRELENKYGFCVWKESKANIRIVNQQLAQNPSDVAKARKEEYLMLRNTDGVCFFTIDKSKGAEHEYIHPDDCISDSEHIEPFFQDMLRDPPTFSQLAALISNLAQAQLNTSKQLEIFIRSIIPKEEPKNDIEQKRADYFG